MQNRIIRGSCAGARIAGVAFAVLLLFAGCAPSPPLEGKKVVRIGMIGPLTGAPATAIQIAWMNLIDYLRYFEEVGIPGVTLPPGVTIELLWGDSGFEASRAVSIYERMRERDAVLFYLPSPLEGEALKSRLERDAVPGVVMSVSEDMMYPPGWVFTVYPTESERFAVVCDWIMENWHEERPPRVAIMGTDSPSGHAPEVMGTRYAQSIGIEMLPFEVVPYMPLDTTAQLLRLRERGADFVYLQTIYSTAIPIMRDAERLGLTDKMRFGGMENSQAISLLELGPVVEGYFAARAGPWHKEVPEMDIFRRYRPGYVDKDGGGAISLVMFPSWIEAISTAIDSVGYENLNGRAVKEGFYTIKDFDPHGIGRTVTYTPEDHRGAPSLRMYEVQGGEAVPVSDWREAPILVPEK